MIGCKKTRSIRVEALWLGLSALTLPPVYSADLEQALFFNIRPQPLESALLEFSRQTKFQVLTASTDLAGYRIGGVRGEMSIRVAMDIMLAGTGLVYRKVGTATISVSRAGPLSNDVGDSSPPYSMDNLSDSKNEKIQESNSMKKKSGFFAWLVALFTACGGGTIGREACAQSVESPDSGQLEEVIVTAERRTADVQKTATSVSVRSGNEMAAQGRTTLGEILRDIPNIAGGDIQVLTFQGPTSNATGGSDSRGNSIVIRGVEGRTVQLSGAVTGTATTAVYADGIYEGIGSEYDIDRVEVLRGPQGTLYGRSATSGVVASYTRNPTFDGLSGDASVQYGSYTLQRYQGALNIPFNDKLAVRVSALNNKQDRKVYQGEGGAYDNMFGRVKLLYQPTDNFSVLAGFAFEEKDQNRNGWTATSPAFGVVVYDTFTTISSTHNHSKQYWLNVDWNLGPASLIYQGSVRDYRQAAIGPGIVTGPLLPAPSTERSFFDQRVNTPYDQTVSHELRMASNASGKLTWQTGLVYYRNFINASSTNQYTTGTPSTTQNLSRDTKDYGVFGEATYAFTDATRLTAGARYDYTEVSVDLFYQRNRNVLCGTADAVPAICAGLVSTGPGTPVSLNPPVIVNENTNPSGLREFRKSNFKIRLEHDLTPANMVYATVSSGFIPGDVTVDVNGATGVSTVNMLKAETLTAYEVGSKNRFLADRLQVNASAFYYDYGGSTAGVNTGATATITFNLDSKTQGLELETLYQLTPNDRLGLNYAYLESWYVRTPAYSALSPWNHRNVVPHTITGNYEHNFDLPGGSALSARIDGTWTSAYRSSNPSYVLLNFGPDYMRHVYRDSEATGNFNLNWISNGGKYSVGGYVRNFTDHVRIDYAVSALSPRNVTARQTDPRTYGVMLSARF